MRMIQDFPEVQIDQASKILMDYGWNYEYACNQYRESKKYKINLILIGGLPYPNHEPT